MLRTIIVILLCCFSVTLTACAGKEGNSGNKKPAPQYVMELPKDKTKKSIQEAVGSTPSTVEENKETGISADNYENYTFAGYNGKISFYYSEGTLLYYKWFYQTDVKNGDTVYRNICTGLSEAYGEGVESNSSNLQTITWKTQEKEIVAQKVTAGNGSIEISYTVVE